jgi:hypothetical protein
MLCVGAMIITTMMATGCTKQQSATAQIMEQTQEMSEAQRAGFVARALLYDFEGLTFIVYRYI